MDKELERFKTDIDLVEYAESKGFVIDKAKSGKKSVVMRRGSDAFLKGGEVVGISFHPRTGHKVYNNFSKGKGGTIIDFVQEELGGATLGFVRKELRAYLSVNDSYKKKKCQPMLKENTAGRRMALKEEKDNSWLDVRRTYLKSRGIRLEVLQDPRFFGLIYTDKYHNALFPHHRGGKFSGFEKRNHRFKGFSASGKKGLWCSNVFPITTKIIFCESAIDCLSHLQLHYGESDRFAYVSLAGQISDGQVLELKRLLARYPDVSCVGGFDNDELGQKYTDILCYLVSKEIEIQVPQNKDWNEDLQQRIIHSTTL